jgi:N-methylhydantoinase B/oxoprolinase/acetone carboxylase alpha subunit
VVTAVRGWLSRPKPKWRSIGHPSRRPEERVLEDIKNGYVTLERAREVYGFSEEEAIVRQDSPSQTELVYK